jgi:transcriptional regulator with XRE-family HTH domain
MRSKSTLHEPIAAAFKASGMTLAELAQKAGLSLTVASMSRKMSGDQRIEVENGEARKLGKVFGLKVVWTGEEFRYEKAPARTKAA